MPTEKNPEGTQRFPSAEERIQQFNQDFGVIREQGGYGEELAACSRVIGVLLAGGELTVEALQQLIQRERESIRLISIYVLSFRVIELAAKTGKMTPEILQIVETFVMNDVHPLWSLLGVQKEKNALVMQQLLTNQYLFELMLPYISDDESGSDAEPSADIPLTHS